MKQSPFFKINYGWAYGADNWNTGMDDNLVVLSFISKHLVNEFLNSEPVSFEDGFSYVYEVDNSVRLFVDGVWKVIYPPDGWSFNLSDGSFWVYENGLPINKPSSTDTSGSIGALEAATADLVVRADNTDLTLTALAPIPDKVSDLEAEILLKANETDLLSVSDRVDTVETEIISHSSAIDANRDNIIDLTTQIDDAFDQLFEKVDEVKPGEGISVTYDTDLPNEPIVAIDTTYTDTLYDPIGSASSVEALLDARLPMAAKIALDALDETTATVEELILALRAT